MNEPLTKKLNSGLVVLAKLYKGEPSAVTYANRSQAEKKVSELGDGWYVYHRGRPFYVAKSEPEAFELRRADGSVWKRLLYRDFANAIAAKDSLLPYVGPLTVVPIRKRCQMESAVKAKPKAGDLYIQVSGSSVWIGEFENGWIGSSTVYRRERRFHNMRTKEYSEAKDFTPRKALDSEWNLHLVHKYLPELAERSLWIMRSYEWNLVGRVGDGVEPAKKSKESAPREEWTFVPGAILYASWGYDQTNIDWYEIIERKSDWVKVEAIGGIRTETGWNVGTTLPNPESRTGKILRRRVSVHNGIDSSIRIESYAYAHLWDGKVKHWSSYA